MVTIFKKCYGMQWLLFLLSSIAPQPTINIFILISGKRCEYLTAVTFSHNKSFAELEPLRTKPDANVTVVFSTTHTNGVMLYDGHSEHLAVELFNGRLRISFDVGNYPVSTMFRCWSKFSIFLYFLPTSVSYCLLVPSSYVIVELDKIC